MKSKRDLIWLSLWSTQNSIYREKVTPPIPSGLDQSSKPSLIEIFMIHM